MKGIRRCCIRIGARWWSSSKGIRRISWRLFSRRCARPISLVHPVTNIVKGISDEVSWGVGRILIVSIESVEGVTDAGGGIIFVSKSRRFVEVPFVSTIAWRMHLVVVKTFNNR